MAAFGGDRREQLRTTRAKLTDQGYLRQLVKTLHRKHPTGQYLKLVWAKALADFAKSDISIKLLNWIEDIQMKGNVAFIGGGAMATATIRGLIQSQICAAGDLNVSDPLESARKELAAQTGVNTHAEGGPWIGEAETIMLVVKPQHVEQAAAQVADFVKEGQIVISFVTGARLSSLEAHLGHSRVVRAMPNTAVQVGRGFTVWSASSAVDESDRSHVRKILNALGSELYTADEHHIDIATAVSASGPAYALLVLESWTDAGVFLGLPRPLAQKMALETIAGTMALCDALDQHPAVLKSQVTSPGGTTARALQVFEEGGIRGLFGRAITAAHERSLDLGS